MRLLIILCLPVLLFLGCRGDHSGSASDTLKQGGLVSDSARQHRKRIDSMIALSARDSSEETTPSQEEERERIRQSYDSLTVIDTVFVNGADTLHFHSKHYCVKQLDLIVPKFYDMDKEKKAFKTHPFAIDLWLTHNRDTVFKHHFANFDFDPFYKDPFGGNLKKYGSIDIDLSNNQPPDHNQINLWVNLAIPSTDLGRGFLLVIDKNGRYKIEGPRD